MNRSFLVAAALLLGPLIISASGAYQQNWEESCKIHTLLEEAQDAENLKAAGELRKSALKSAVVRDVESEREAGLLSELRVVKLKQANLIIHVRNLSRCMDGFAETMSADVEQKVSQLKLHNFDVMRTVFPELISVILGIFVLILAAVFGVAHLLGVEIKRKSND